MQGQRGQDFETAARGRHSFRFLGPRPNDRLSHPVKEAAYRAAIHLNPQRGVERLAHFLQAALGIALMRAPQERLRLGGEFATISLTPPVQETGEALGRQAGLVTKILWPTKGHRVSAEKLVHGQIGSSDLFYHRCDLLGSAFPAGRGPVHPPQHSLNMAIWPACSAVFVRSWGIKRYNWTMLFRGEDSSSSWLLIISSTDSFLRARESRSYVELRSGPVSANCNSPKYQTIVMLYRGALQSWRTCKPACRGCAPSRLHSHCRRGYFRRRRRLGLRCSILAASHGIYLRRHSDRHHRPQPSRRARCWPCFRSSHLSLCRHTSHYHRRRRSPRPPQRRASHTGGASSASAAHGRSRQLLAASEGFRQR